jgi:hypothetical protein
MERNTKKGLEESAPDIHVLITEIIVAIMHTTYFNMQELCILHTVSNGSQNKQILFP